MGAAAAAAVVGGGQLAMGVYQGRQAKKAADIEAQNVRIQAEADVAKLQRELEEALSAQQVLFGAQGRVVEGSAKAVTEGDKAAAAKDIRDIRAGAARRAEGLRSAGRTARTSAIAGGLLSAGSTYMSYKMVK